MTKVLFVDDDPSLLAGLRRSLYSMRNQWEMTFANNAYEALEVVKSNDFDVVVSDMRMPGIDGAELLTRIRESHPRMARLILSGQSEMAAVMRSVPVAHQFLNKPCDVSVLTAAVSRACQLMDRLSNRRLQEMTGRLDVLPSPSSLVQELNHLLLQPDCSIDAVARLVREDVALTAKLLQLVNSAFFGLAQRVTRVEDAVAYLGVSNIRSLVSAVEIFRSVRQDGAEAMDRLHAHSLAVGHLARHLARGTESESDAFVAGMLHDVGLFVIAAGAPDEFAELMERSKKDDVDFNELEQELFGLSHADLGAHLMNLWGLPTTITEAVARHHDAQSLGAGELDACHAVYVAELLISKESDDLERGLERLNGTLDPAYVEALGIANEVSAWRKRDTGTSEFAS